MLIDFLDTGEFFFALHDHPAQVERLIDLVG